MKRISLFIILLLFIALILGYFYLNKNSSSGNKNQDIHEAGDFNNESDKDKSEHNKNSNIPKVVKWAEPPEGLTRVSDEAPENSTLIKEFRGVNWGYSKEQVKSSENVKPYKEDEDAIYYEDEIYEMQANLIYSFFSDSLYQANYQFTYKREDFNDYIEDYEKLFSALNFKYGNPILNDTVWTNDYYIGESSQWGYAISQNHVSFYSEWRTEKTIIIMELSGENNVVSIDIWYDSVDLKMIQAADKYNKNLDKL